MLLKEIDVSQKYEKYLERMLIKDISQEHKLYLERKIVRRNTSLKGIKYTQR
jgi:hypothetical protein